MRDSIDFHLRGVKRWSTDTAKMADSLRVVHFRVSLAALQQRVPDEVVDAVVRGTREQAAGDIDMVRLSPLVRKLLRESGNAQYAHLVPTLVRALQSGTPAFLSLGEELTEAVVREYAAMCAALERLPRLRRKGFFPSTYALRRILLALGEPEHADRVPAFGIRSSEKLAAFDALWEAVEKEGRPGPN